MADSVMGDAVKKWKTHWMDDRCIDKYQRELTDGVDCIVAMEHAVECQCGRRTSNMSCGSPSNISVMYANGEKVTVGDKVKKAKSPRGETVKVGDSVIDVSAKGHMPDTGEVTDIIGSSKYGEHVVIQFVSPSNTKYFNVYTPSEFKRDIVKNKGLSTDFSNPQSRGYIPGFETTPPSILAPGSSPGSQILTGDELEHLAQHITGAIGKSSSFSQVKDYLIKNFANLGLDFNDSDIDTILKKMQGG